MYCLPLQAHLGPRVARVALACAVLGVSADSNDHSKRPPATRRTLLALLEPSSPGPAAANRAPHECGPTRHAHTTSSAPPASSTSKFALTRFARMSTAGASGAAEEGNAIRRAR